MNEIILETLRDSFNVLPFLFVVYVLIELIEHKYSHKMGHLIEKSGKAGPLWGALAGGLPQCGFSVIGSVLYTQRFITVGTLLAVYLSTSDEAIPLILSDPDKVHMAIPLISIKVVIGIVFGFLVDFIFRTRLKIDKNTGACIEEKGCCGHQADSDKLAAKNIILHPIIHTAKILFFILVITFLLNLSMARLGEDKLQELFLNNSVFQPVLAALIGLIPNCAASVALTKLYLSGIIGFGSVVAGLSAGAGLGLIVLFKDNKDKWDSIRILLLLFLLSSISGLLINLFSF